MIGPGREWTPEAKWARDGLMRNAGRFPSSRFADPVAYADAVTSSHDWRIALCIGLGVPLEHIDPSGGYDLTPRRAEQLALSLDGAA